MQTFRATLDRRAIVQRAVIFLSVAVSGLQPARAELPDVIDKIRPSVVAIGTFKRLRSPAFLFRGTGFAVGNGTTIVTNAHVLPRIADPEENGALVALVLDPDGTRSTRDLKELTRNTENDLAVLGLAGPPIPPLTVQASGKVREGQSIAFSGFPIGSVLGVAMVTHRGTISSITPIALPGGHASEVNEKMARRLRTGAINIFQLDATAYPGNSGGPVFDINTGAVIGILNMTLVKSTKESVLERPSGISYAIPADYLLDTLAQLQNF